MVIDEKQSIIDSFKDIKLNYFGIGQIFFMFIDREWLITDL